MARPTATFKATRAHLLRRSAELDEEQARIKRQLADLEHDDAPATTYSSVDLPRHVSRRAFRSRCSSGAVAGARREGKVWICGRAEWHAALTRRPAPSLRVVASSTDEMIAAAALQSFRATRTA